ncbi:TonB-linked outer membrane protein, SusC/RagA family [Catalinimonas alkaloidigena]|uniref:TonB-linked outer membrane protein, SusC/RagA family n=1 Tax=Catalinimonas alkaloidigena TaxID=1075417 RepID=A0A1G9GXD8_9BACT|nr:SusC/RagA family TonB-linked outer membrane protein [Catalinimonas alkaloidigena]SDL05254.1 TonB-linked outer membrane protein, SusC/RagA family [Catalinimonas alkaloidigena]
MRKLLLAFLSLSLFIGEGWAQKTVSGRVTSEADGVALPGVNVLVKGTTAGTITDYDGKYQLEVPSSATTLVFSFIGMTSQEVELGNRSVVDVVMSEDAKQLSEVVVTALGIEREEKALGYAVQEIDGSALTTVKETNVVNSLAGRVAGVQIKGSPGNMGGSASINIRGIRSVSGNNQPLFIIDGTPISNDNFNSDDTQGADGGRDYGNAAQDINPDDIANISVLKGPSATALYGSRAANGVILITTKSGKNKKGIGVSLNSTTTFESVMALPEFQNEYGGGYKQEFDTYNGQPIVNYAADESWGPRMDGTPVRQWYSWFEDDPDYGQLTPFVAHPNNVRDFFETGITSSNNIAITGSTDNTSMRLSYTRLDQKGVIPNSTMARNTVAFSGESKLTDKLTVGVKANYVGNSAKGRPGTGYGADAGNVVTSFRQWFQRQIDIDKLKNYETPDGLDRTWNINSPNNLDPLYWENPYWVLNKSYETDSRERLFGNIYASYQLLPSLKVTGWARTDFYTDRRDDRIASGSIPQDMYQEDVRQVREDNFEFLAQYNTNFGDNFSLGVNLGANSRRNTYQRNYNRTVGGLSVPNYFNIGASIDRPEITDYSEEKRVNSLYGSANLGFYNVVFVEASLRNDWSSSLPPENNSYLYPSASVSFAFSELLPSSSVFSFGKVRAGWAQVGTDTDPYRVYNTYTPSDNYGSLPAFAQPNTLNNRDLKPEQSTSYELGLDTRFFNGRIGLDLTYYNNISINQIIPLAVSGTSGYDEAIINAGEIRNNGIEVMLSGTPIQGAFTWDIGLNWARNRNEIVELADGLDNILLYSWGVTLNARKGEPYGVLVGDAIKRDAQGRKLVDGEGNYVRETNKVYGSVLADYTGGITNTFTYKGFHMNVLIDFQKGGKFYSVSNRYGTYSGLLIETVGNNALGNPMRDPVLVDEDTGEPLPNSGGILADGVLEDGTPNTTYVDAQNYWKNLRNYREEFTYDASFAKLRQLNFGYTFPKSMYKSLPFQSISLDFVGRHLAILWKKAPNVDPETALGSGNIQGFENGQLPSVRSMGFNLKVTL